MDSGLTSRVLLPYDNPHHHFHWNFPSIGTNLTRSGNYAFSGFSTGNQEIFLWNFLIVLS